MLQNYMAYLEYLETKLSKFFKQQEPFIFCKKGCAKCCKKAEFPFSELEIKYLLIGFLALSPDVQAKVEQNIQTLYEERKIFEGEKFLYDCPFLIDDVCCVYEYRGIICRAFGLMTQEYNTDNIKAPFCFTQDLNYSNVLDENGKLNQEKIDKRGFKEEPIAYNVSYKFLTSKVFEDDFHIKFGENKPMLNWFIDDALAAEKSSNQ